nr:ABC transporter permease [bacterium]
MKTIATVFGFTFREGLRKKTFLVSTILVCVILLVLCVIPNFFADKEEEPLPPEGAERSNICYIIDEGGVMPGLEEVLSAGFTSIGFVPAPAAQLEDIRQRIAKEEQLSALVLEKTQGLPQMTFYAKSFMSSLPVDAIGQTVKNIYVSGTLQAIGVPADVAALAAAQPEVDMITLGKMELPGYILGIVITMVMFFAIYMYGYWVAMSVASEKTSRVMETLVVSAKPCHILLGKCLAMGALGLFQLVIFLIVGVIGVTVILPGGLVIGGMSLDFSVLTVPSTLLLLAYFILGFALYALLNSVCGATVSRTEDINAALTPVMMITMLSFYIAYFGAILPGGGTLKAIATWVPFTSPFVIPFRLLNEAVPTGDIICSMAILLVSIVAIAAVSIRLYTVSVLHYGQRLKLKDLFKARM